MVERTLWPPTPCAVATLCWRGEGKLGEGKREKNLEKGKREKNLEKGTREKRGRKERERERGEKAERDALDLTTVT